MWFVYANASLAAALWKIVSTVSIWYSGSLFVFQLQGTVSIISFLFIFATSLICPNYLFVDKACDAYII